MQGSSSPYGTTLQARRRFDDAIDLVSRLATEAELRGIDLAELDAPSRATTAFAAYYELDALVDFLTELRSRETF